MNMQYNENESLSRENGSESGRGQFSVDSLGSLFRTILPRVKRARTYTQLVNRHGTVYFFRLHNTGTRRDFLHLLVGYVVHPCGCLNPCIEKIVQVNI